MFLLMFVRFVHIYYSNTSLSKIHEITILATLITLATVILH